MTTQAGPFDGVDMALCHQCRDHWAWVVIYRDQSMVYECQGSTAPHAAWKDVNPRLVSAITLLPRLRLAGRHEVIVHIPQGSTPVMFRRRQIELNMTGGEQSNTQTIHCLGYEAADHGSYLFVFEDGSTLLTNNRNAV
jgi:hypothetical protein